MKTKNSSVVKIFDALTISIGVVLIMYFYVILSIHTIHIKHKPYSDLIKQGYDPLESNLPPSTVTFYDTTLPPYKMIFVHEKDFLPPGYFYRATKKIEQEPYSVLGISGRHLVMDYRTGIGTFIGNVSLVRVLRKNYICTAIHCVEDMNIPYIAVGSDVALIPDTLLVQKMEYYTNPIQPNLFKNGKDSIFIKGYYLGLDEGYITPVTLSGIGEQCILTSPRNLEGHVRGNSVFMKLGTFCDLHGISGSPAFNSKGEIVGVASTQHIAHVDGKFIIYVRVSLFGI